MAWSAFAQTEEKAPGREMAIQATKAKPIVNTMTADHTKFKELQFSPEEQRTLRPEQVTATCLKCHNKAALQFHKTIHWTWRDMDDNGNPTKLGKGGIAVNNFCINVVSNEPRCTSCHAGYGWKDKTFDFTSQDKVDCLVCHEQTGTYKKFPAGAGYPAPYVPDPDNPGKQKGKFFKSNGKTYYAPDWAKVAQSVGRPSRRNCGTCHFFGGGGDAVKHGDLDSSLVNPVKDLDVHMGSVESGGQDFSCARCHTTRNHHVAGRIYGKPAAVDRKSLLQDDLGDKIMCESCHGTRPHESGGMDAKLNDHTDKLACQACHIPQFARAQPTKMWWDWSKAGTLMDGKAVVMGENGKPAFDKKKGEFVWEKNVVPEYFWFNGAMGHVTVEDTIDPSHEVWVSRPIGSVDDPNSRIMPFKVHRGKTPYDRSNNVMVIPHLFPRGKDDKDAFWKTFDWNRAIAAGMKYAGYKYSGEFGFVNTAYVFPATHMVAPKTAALECAQCHTRQSRLSNITEVYMPGRDTVSTIDMFGWVGAGVALVAVILHGFMRFISGLRRKED
ncbi:tetrathionate reductase family octaheme c-type cytochrome [Salidesulfovibrio onnuriiensis]|uniref:tetrathionate reductase family octaheme c-type cytochrome n=1 Tax=Salidesulfovibrio onnuriiensis TaxID=2583823 RepID=UPI001C9D6531